MKLGLIITNTNGGEQEAYAINKNETWAKFASDARSLIKELANFDGTGKSVRFLKFIGKLGYFICVVKARPAGSGREWDNTAAWIYIPANVDIAGTEEESVIHIVENAISGEREIDKISLDNEFSKDFVEKDVLFTPIYEIASQSDGGVAGLFYGKETAYQLHELLGNGIGQPEYKKYRAIFLLDKEQSISMSNNNVLNIKSRSGICHIEPPVCNDFTPYLHGSVVFDQPIEVYVGQLLTVTWKRQDYKEIAKTVRAKDLNAEASNREFAFTDADIMFAVYREWFQVHFKNELLRQCRIKVENQQLDKVIYLPESKRATVARVTVTAEGFMPFEKDMLLSSNIDIPMKEVMYHYEFTIPMYAEEKHKFSIPMYAEEKHIGNGNVTFETSQTLKNCPIKGYSMDKDNNIKEGKGYVNHLKEDRKSENIKHFAYGFLSCFLVFLLLWAGWNVRDDYEFNFGWPLFKEKQVIETPPTETPEAPKDSTEKSTPEQELSKAIEYLNNTPRWDFRKTKDYRCLDGLFEDLNNYKLEEIVNKWNFRLKDVTRFKDVVTAANTAIAGKWDVRQGSHSPSYNQEGDSLIYIPNYVEWLSKDQAPKPEETKQHPATNHIKPDVKQVKKEQKANQSAAPKSDNNKTKRRGGIK